MKNQKAHVALDEAHKALCKAQDIKKALKRKKRWLKSTKQLAKSEFAPTIPSKTTRKGEEKSMPDETTITDLCKILGITPRRVRKYIRDGKITISEGHISSASLDGLSEKMNKQALIRALIYMDKKENEKP